jgi:hypothetical protein
MQCDAHNAIDGAEINIMIYARAMGETYKYDITAEDIDTV